MKSVTHQNNGKVYWFVQYVTKLIISGVWSHNWFRFPSVIGNVQIVLSVLNAVQSNSLLRKILQTRWMRILMRNTYYHLTSNSATNAAKMSIVNPFAAFVTKKLEKVVCINSLAKVTRKIKPLNRNRSKFAQKLMMKQMKYATFSNATSVVSTAICLVQRLPMLHLNHSQINWVLRTNRRHHVLFINVLNAYS